MAAADHERQRRELDGLRLQNHRVDVALDVVDRDQRHACGETQRFGISEPTSSDPTSPGPTVTAMAARSSRRGRLRDPALRGRRARWRAGARARRVRARRRRTCRASSSAKRPRRRAPSRRLRLRRRRFHRRRIRCRECALLFTLTRFPLRPETRRWRRSGARRTRAEIQQAGGFPGAALGGALEIEEQGTGRMVPVRVSEWSWLRC